MTAAGLYLILAASVGTIHSGHDTVRAECSDCGAEQSAVQEKVVKLRTASLWVVRRKAARGLRAYDWERHPEAVEALADAVLHDRQCLVRQEAAESLGKMKPCLPVAHEALACAAESDKSLIARHAAKKALKAVGKSCVEPCDVCGVDSEVIEEGIPPFRADPGDAAFPTIPETSPIVPETSLDPLTPTSLEVPVLPPTPSPFIPDPDAPFPARPPVGRPRIHPEDAVPLTPPSAPVDRLNPRPDELPPTPLGDDAAAPRPAWPSQAFATGSRPERPVLGSQAKVARKPARRGDGPKR
ncbi:HEAT repeat domain-containing protein [Paludisphaera mucosa]|uniref:HEAT repeat domain-containing protein n=1 Tax=Paludisphaera mucosa TaxID=3030827 RepID=A0ABT6F7S9_9BACT|nr:HEAT repeat domain-containing protein [Paludisphaera mucosa]MDG3003463.1 HEAT repeat domain-containing protein [Paludisphaera mucosa]